MTLSETVARINHELEQLYFIRDYAKDPIYNGRIFQLERIKLELEYYERKNK